MNLKEVRQLAKMQGVEEDIRIVLKCPRCENQSLDVKIKGDVGYCFKCNYSLQDKDMDAFKSEVMYSWLERHQEVNEMMTSSKGVCG